jgi:hypothetical protein
MGVKALRCPRCDKVFHFRPGSGKQPLAPKVDVELAGPLPPGSVRPPTTMPASSPPPRPLSGNIVTPSVPGRHRQKVSGGLRSVMPALIVVGIAVVLVLGGFFMFRTSRAERGAAVEDPVTPVRILNGKVVTLDRRQEQAFRLTLPAEVWTTDPTKKALRPVVALKQTDADVWLAVAVKDYGPHRPRDAELMQEAVGRLEKYFGDNLELGARAEPEELAGVPVQRLEFKGMVDKVVWHGDCRLLTHQGLGYWLFVAAPRLAAAREAWAELQQSRTRGFAVATDREGWTEQPLPTETFRGERCELRAPQGVWTKFKATAEDERGDLLLVGRDVRETDATLKNVKNATILVLVFDKSQPSLGETLKRARDHIQAKKQSEDKDYKLGPAADQPGSEPEAIGDRRGMIVELKLLHGTEPRRYILLAVLQEAEAAYAMRCECSWEYRQIWQSEFRDLLRTFRLRKPAAPIPRTAPTLIGAAARQARATEQAWSARPPVAARPCPGRGRGVAARRPGPSRVGRSASVAGHSGNDGCHGS